MTRTAAREQFQPALRRETVRRVRATLVRRSPRPSARQLWMKLGATIPSPMPSANNCWVQATPAKLPYRTPRIGVTASCRIYGASIARAGERRFLMSRGSAPSPIVAALRHGQVMLAISRIRRILYFGRPQDDVVTGGIVRRTACACARRPQGGLATLAPRFAGLKALTTAPRTLVQTWLLPMMPESRSSTCCGRRSVQNDAARRPLTGQTRTHRPPRRSTDDQRASPGSQSEIQVDFNAAGR